MCVQEPRQEAACNARFLVERRRLSRSPSTIDTFPSEIAIKRGKISMGAYREEEVGGGASRPSSEKIVPQGRKQGSKDGIEDGA